MRKIHLDFHTNENIKICQNWNAEEFGNTLKEACVSQIVCFAKCHHGNCYWNSKIGPKHPHLPKGLDLLQDQIKSCRKNGIRINGYYSVMLDQVLVQKIKVEFEKMLEDDDTNENPETPLPKARWMQCNQAGIPAFNDGHYGQLCLNSPYVDEIVIPHVKELLEYDLDGLWFDICRQGPCFCDHCLALHKKWGLDLQKSEDNIRLTSLTMNHWITKIVQVIRAKKPNIEVFFNTIDHFGATSSNGGDFIVNDYQDAWEQESLPTGGWGYWYFPIIGRYYRRIPLSVHSKAVIPNSEPRLYGMTGMFRGGWGDNGSLKSSRALLTESASIISLGYAGVDIGDQLHPSGKLEPAVYATIGKAFKYVEEREPWIKHSQGVADVAVLGATPGVHDPPMVLKSLVKMLVENHVQFDVVDQNQVIEKKYKLLIVPDYDLGPNEKSTQNFGYLPITNEGWIKISDFGKDGGKILLFGKGPSGRTIGTIQLPAVSWAIEHDVCYLNSKITPVSDNFYPGHDYVLYSTFLKSQSSDFSKWESKFDIHTAYYPRTVNNFSSHRHWPVNRENGNTFPGAIQKDNVLWILAPLCRQYWARDDDNLREIFKDLVKKFVPDLILDAPNFPAGTEINLTYQSKENRYMLHVINWGMKRPASVSPIYEAPFDLPQGPVMLRICNSTFSIISCRLVPDGKSVEWKMVDEKTVAINVPPTGFNSIIEISGK